MTTPSQAAAPDRTRADTPAPGALVRARLAWRRLPARARGGLQLLGAAAVYWAVAAAMFAGTSDLGMEYDEVFRLNNLIPVWNDDADPYNQAISSVTVFGTSVPLMYKAYVSSAFLWPFWPLPLFQDPVADLRFLYLFYLVLAAWLAFALFRRHHALAAFVIPLLALVNPLLYPDVTYGFVDLKFLIPLLPGVWALWRFLEVGRLRYLLLVGFLVGAAVNMAVYSAWVVLGLGVALVALYPRAALRLLRPREALCLLLGAAVGAFNYVYYNVTDGFPTVRPFVDRIFFPDRYEGIDFRESGSLPEEVLERLGILYKFFGVAGAAFVAIAVVAAAVTIACAVVAARTHAFADSRLLFVPAIATTVGLAAVLVSPNTTRRGHYGVFFGLMEAALVAAFVLAVRFGPEALRRLRVPVATVLVVLLFAGAAVTSRTATQRVIGTGGTGFFSSAIFDLYEYVVEEGIDEEDLLQVQWGTGAQLYYLSGGEYSPLSTVFEVLGAPEEDERIEYVVDALMISDGDAFVPVYVDVPPTNGVDPTGLLEATVETTGGTICTLEVFTDRIGKEAIRLYRVTLSPAQPATADASRPCTP